MDLRLSRPTARRAPAPAGVWLITFTDLICLIVAFFVMMFAMARPAHPPWHDLAASLSGRLNPTGAAPARPSRAVFNIAGLDETRAIDLNYLAAVLAEHLAADPELAGARIVRSAGGLVVPLAAAAAGEPGDGTLAGHGRHLIFALAGLLARVGNRIEVVAETDTAATADAEPSEADWQVALERAEVVAVALRRAGYDRDVAVRAVAASVPAAPRRLDITVRTTGER